MKEARSYLHGRYRILNVEFRETPLEWHLDPQTGTRAPREFGPDLDYRDPSRVGNVKNVWEKNRHHHLTVLAAAYALTGNERFAAEVGNQLTSWLRENPVMEGVNWTSPLEMGIRLLAWVWIERLLRESDEHGRLFGPEGVLWPSIYWQQRIIDRMRARGSSANNHLIGEMAALFISATVWPCYEESEQWRREARRRLERELARQTFPSGLNREQAFGYHLFTLEFFLLAGLEGHRYRRPFSSGYEERVSRMLEVIPRLMDVGGNLPRYGDDDEGMALQLRPRRGSRLAWLLRLGRHWPGARIAEPPTDDGMLAVSLLGIGDHSETEDLYGESPRRSGAAPVRESPDGPAGDDLSRAQARDVRSSHGSEAFPDAGLYALVDRRGSSDELFCLADAGPLGYLSLAAHGHADALSFTLSVGGVRILVDAGTYAYHAEPEWREYFRGTGAHNTVVVDGADQSESGGLFLWTRKATTRVLAWEEHEEGATLEAEHDGYRRLPGEVVHRRRFSLTRRELRIRDDLEGRGRHRLEWRLHFAPECTVELEEKKCRVEREGRVVTLRLDPAPEWGLVRGGANGGWYSPGFNLKVPTATLLGTLRTELPSVLESRILVEP